MRRSVFLAKKTTVFTFGWCYSVMIGRWAIFRRSWPPDSRAAATWLYPSPKSVCWQSSPDLPQQSSWPFSLFALAEILSCDTFSWQKAWMVWHLFNCEKRKRPIFTLLHIFSVSTSTHFLFISLTHSFLLSVTFWQHQAQHILLPPSPTQPVWPEKNRTNVYKSWPKMILLEKW